MSSIKLFNAALDKFQAGPDQPEVVVIRGVITPESFREIKVGDYQREVLSEKKVTELKIAIRTSQVPDIELGMRGMIFRKGGDGVFHLQDPTYVIDGLQRITAAMRILGENAKAQPRLGALVHLGTTEKWERERFRILNQERSRLSPNVLLRNLRSEHDSIEMLFKLSCEDRSFSLYDRVQWSQNMRKTELLPAMLFIRSITILHSRFCTGGKGNHPTDLALALNQMIETVGRTTLRENIRQFFELVDDCYGIRRVSYREGAVHMRSTFLTVLADVLTRHQNFWDGKRLKVERSLRHKIAQFSTHDPTVMQLAGAGGQARNLLYSMFVEHINKNKRTGHLRPVDGMEPRIPEPEEREEEPVPA